MSNTKSNNKSYSEKYITITIHRDSHKEVKDFLDDRAEGGAIASFYMKAASHLLAKLRARESQFELLNTTILLRYGWEKSGSSTYKRGNDVVMYTGAIWYYNGEQLTKDNYIEKIGDKISAKINPNIPIKNK